MSNQNLIYGWHAVLSALENSSGTMDEIYLLKNIKDDNKKTKIQKLAATQQIKIIALSRQEMDRLANTEKHQGVIAKGQKMMALKEDDITDLLENIDHDPFILILDLIQDPHNLGAILRTANCAGIDCVIAPKDKSVGITPTVSKVASGAAEVIPFIQVTNLARVMEDLKQRGIWIYGLAGDGAESLYQQSFSGPIALAMGAEGKGLRQNTMNHCDALLSIPMAGSVSSLNVSVATGVAVFEVVRQKSI